MTRKEQLLEQNIKKRDEFRQFLKDLNLTGPSMSDKLEIGT